MAACLPLRKSIKKTCLLVVRACCARHQQEGVLAEGSQAALRLSPVELGDVVLQQGRQGR